MKLNFIDLSEQQKRLQPGISQAIERVLAHGRYIMGPEVVELEEKLAAFAGVKHCVSVSSGTDALLMAKMALGICAGDEVITTPFTWVASAETIGMLGAKPVFVDIDPKTFNIDATKIESVITEKTKAILPVSLYGQCADMDKINSIAKKYNLHVIEDAAQSFGATQGGVRSCALSEVGCTSFFPSKPLGCYGDGGACFTNNDGIAKIIREIRVHGQERRYEVTRLGVNGRLDTIQAAILLQKLSVFEDEVKRRQQVAEWYRYYLPKDIASPYILPTNSSVYAQYTIIHPDRDALQSALKAKGIPTAVYYPKPLHFQPVHAALDHKKGDFPITEALSNQVVSLPMHPYLDEESVSFIAKQVEESCIQV